MCYAEHNQPSKKEKLIIDGLRQELQYERKEEKRLSAVRKMAIGVFVAYIAVLALLTVYAVL